MTGEFDLSLLLAVYGSAETFCRKLLVTFGIGLITTIGWCILMAASVSANPLQIIFPVQFPEYYPSVSLPIGIEGLNDGRAFCYFQDGLKAAQKSVRKTPTPESIVIPGLFYTPGAETLQRGSLSVALPVYSPKFVSTPALLSNGSDIVAALMTPPFERQGNENLLVSSTRLGKDRIAFVKYVVIKGRWIPQIDEESISENKRQTLYRFKEPTLACSVVALNQNKLLVAGQYARKRLAFVGIYDIRSRKYESIDIPFQFYPYRAFELSKGQVMMLGADRLELSCGKVLKVTCTCILDSKTRHWGNVKRLQQKRSYAIGGCISRDKIMVVGEAMNEVTDAQFKRGILMSTPPFDLSGEIQDISSSR